MLTLPLAHLFAHLLAPLTNLLHTACFAHKKEVFVQEMYASILYSFNPLCIDWISGLVLAFAGKRKVETMNIENCHVAARMGLGSRNFRWLRLLIAY